jgi:hypothetical protein
MVKANGELVRDDCKEPSKTTRVIKNAVYEQTLTNSPAIHCMSDSTYSLVTTREIGAQYREPRL